ncbi:Alpha/Beta hydrolase protein [Fusarium oxysporum]|nr:Alpha/Beta hydrolase protein [Fusarium oxysporum]
MARSTTPGFDKAFARTLCDLQVPKVLKFSPNGRQLLYSTSLIGGHRKGKNALSTIWIASSSEPSSSRQLTSGLYNDTWPRWHPDGNRIAFLSDRAKAGESSAIYILRMDGGDAIPITNAENEEDIDTFLFSPDGKTIAYVSPDEKSEDEKEKSEKDEPDPEVWGEKWDFARLRLVDVESHETKVLVGGDTHVGEFSWSPDGKKVVFMSQENPHIEEAMLTGTTISTVDVETGEVTELCKIMNEPYDLTWAPDGQVYFITGVPADKDTGGRAVYRTDPKADTRDFVKVACGVDDDAGGLHVVGGKVLVNRQVRFVDAISEIEGDDLFDEKKEFWVYDVFVNQETGTSTLAASLSDAGTPYDIFVIESGKEKIKISNHGKPLADRSLGSSTVLTCRSTDDEVELDGLYFTPSSKANSDTTSTKPLPTFVLIHGGPTSRDTDTFDTTCFNWAPYILSKGYGILLPQYRGSSGRGEKFASYSMGGQGKYDYADVVAITDNAIKKGFADPKKLIVGGWSQGGLLTYLCSVRNGLHGLGWRFNAAIAGAGVCDIESLALSADLGSTYEIELAGGNTIWTLNRDDTRNRQGSALWEVASAVKHTKETGEMVIPPMLIFHGDKDERCPFSQAEGFRRALRHWGLKCEFVKFPGEGHGIEQQRFWFDMFERIGRWCDTYIGDGVDEHEMKLPETITHMAIMPHPLLQTEADHSAPVVLPPPNATSLTPKERNPIYLRSFLRYAIGAAATSTNEALALRVMKHDPVFNTYTLIPMKNSRLKKPGDLEVVVITAAEMKKMPDRWGGKITKDTTTRTGPSLAEFPGSVPEFGEVKDVGLEVLAWRVFGSEDKVFMDTDGFGLPGVSGMIQAWFERI